MFPSAMVNQYFHRPQNQRKKKDKLINASVLKM